MRQMYCFMQFPLALGRCPWGPDDFGWSADFVPLLALYFLSLRPLCLTLCGFGRFAMMAQAV